MATDKYITPQIKPHQAMIDDLVREFPEVRPKGFWVAMRALHDAEYVTGLLREDKAWAASVRFMPDAYAIDEESRVVTIFEVVSTHDISRIKMNHIVEFAWALDSDYWNLYLVRCDIGGRKGYDPIALYITERFERVNDPVLAENVKEHAHWKRYTEAYCKAHIDGELDDTDSNRINAQRDRVKTHSAH